MTAVMIDHGHFSSSVRMTREQNRAEKESRIRAAAAELFNAHGFEGTTTTEVAARAGVAKGTLFLYARTKEELVALIFEERIRRALARAFSTLEEGSITDEASQIFGTFFQVYAPTPELARIFVRELMFPAAGIAEMRTAAEHQLIAGLAERIALRVRAGELAEVDATFVATLWFGHYIIALIAWLSGVLPNRKTAQASLHAALELSVRGLLPRPSTPGAMVSGQKEEEACTPPRKTPRISTQTSAPSSTTARGTLKRTGSATAATKKRGSR